MRQDARLKLLIFFCVFSGFLNAHDPHFALWYNKPAKKWEEALPVGNGRLGAMVYGKVHEEIIQLNEDTMYSGKYQDANNPLFFEGLQEVKRLLALGLYEQAHEIAEKKLVCRGRGSDYCQTANSDYGSYQTLGDLILTFHHQPDVKNYFRKLDLQQAIATTEYEIENVKYSREIFTSHPEQAIIVRLTANKSQQLNFDVTLKRLENSNVSIENSTVIMTGSLYPDGINYAAHAAVIPNGGRISENNGDCISVRDADEALIIIVASTTFREENPTKANHHCIQKIGFYTYQELKERHIEVHQAIFNRCFLNLPTNFNSFKPTSERLWDIKEGAIDLSLFSLYFNYGRYLLISSSRNPSLPANLQGIWTDQILTPWCGDFHLNINLQMNYWPAEVANMSECSDPLDDFIIYLEKCGQKTAREMYHAGGWVAHHISNIWGFTAPAEHPSWGLFQGGSAWLCRHLWEKFLFSCDLNYLKKIYPTLKGASQFYLETLYADSITHKLLPNPSNSPENCYLLNQHKLGYLSKAATIELSLIRDIFINVIDACKILKIDADYACKLEDALEQLYPYQIDQNGLLKEYAEDFPLPYPGHRHMSHLYGLYPAYDSLLVSSQALLEAARKSLDHRWEHGNAQTGWNLAWNINLFARLEDKQKSYQALVNMLACSTLPNLFDNHPPFQIDGNFGGIAGIAEMLVQSHTDEVVLLPALPDAWTEGFVKGIKARGGLEVSLKWRNMHLEHAELIAHSSNIFHIRLPANHTIKGMIINGMESSFESQELIKIILNANDKVSLYSLN